MNATQLEAEYCAPRVLQASPSGAVIRGYIPLCDEYKAHLSFPMDNLKWTTGLLPKGMQLSRGRGAPMAGLSFIFCYILHPLGVTKLWLLGKGRKNKDHLGPSVFT